MRLANEIAMIGGVAVGAYTQGGGDHPVAALIGASIGAAVGANIKFPVHNRRSIGANIIGVKSIDAAQAKMDRARRDAKTSLNKLYVDMDGAIEKGKNIDGYVNRLRNIQVSLLKNNLNVGGEVANDLGRIRSIYDAIDTISDINAIRDIGTFSSISETAVFGSVKGITFNQHVPHVPIDAPAGVDMARKIDAMSKYYVDQLGWSQEEASGIAERIGKSLHEKGFGYRIVDGELVVTAHDESTVAKFGMTKNTDGILTSTKGSNEYAVTRFNPHVGTTYMNDDPALTKLRGYLPEEAIAFAQHERGGTPKAQIRNAAAYASTLLEYDATASAGGKNMAAVHNSNRLNIGRVIDYSKNPNGVFRAIKETSASRGVESEYASIVRRLSLQYEGNILNGISGNDRKTVLAGDAVAKGLHRTSFDSLFGQPGRNDGSVHDRDRQIISEHMDDLKKVLSNPEFTAPNAMVAKRFDIDDISEARQSMIHELFGAQVSFGDGAGVFRADESFKTQSNFSIKLSTNKEHNGYISFMGDLNRYLEIKDPTQRRAAIQANAENLTLGAGQRVGVSDNGVESIKGFLTSATLRDVEYDGSNVKLSFSGQFKPGENEYLKVFSVSSKAGLTGMTPENYDMLRQTFEFSDSELAGIIEKSKISKGKAKGAIDYDVLSQLLNARKSSLPQTNYMLRAEDSGADFFNILDDVGPDSKAAGKYAHFEDGARPIYKNLSVSQFIQDRVLGSKHELTRKKAAAYLLAQSDVKIAQDTFLSIKMSKNNKHLVPELNRIEAEKLLLSSDDTVRSNAQRVLYQATQNMSGNDFKNMKSIVTPGEGMAIHGAGKKGRMSWNEIMQLRQNGYTLNDISKIARFNEDAVYEFASAVRMSSAGDPSIDNFLTTRENMRKYGALINAAPESRPQLMKDMGLNLVDNVVSHPLSLEYDGIKSVSLPVFKTNRSGYMDFDGRQLMSQYDKARSKVVELDLQHRMQGSSITEKALRESIDELAQFLRSATSGDNNLFKNTLGMDADASRIFTSRVLSGKMGKEASEEAIGGVFMSMDDVHGMIRSSGLDPKIVKITTSTNGNVLVNGKELMGQMVREPAQGPMSSRLVRIKTMSNLKGQNSVFISSADKIYSKFQFGDFDADQMRITSLAHIDDETLERLKGINAKMYEQARGALDLIDAINPKGASKSIATLSSFQSQAAYEDFMNASAVKAKGTKISSPLATEFAVKMSDSLQRAKDLGQIDEKSLANARILLHGFVENLLKTKHSATQDIQARAISKPEDIMNEFNAHIRGDGNVDAFGKNIRGLLNQFFDVDTVSTKLSAGDKMGPEIEERVRQVKASGDKAIDDIVNASRFLRESDAATPLSLDRSGTTGETLQRMASVASKDSTAIGALEGVQSSDRISNLTRQGKFNAEEASRFIKDTYAKNKKLLIVGAVGLAATAMAIGSEQPNYGAAALPAPVNNGGLPPMNNQNAYMSGKIGQKSGSNVNVSATPRRGTDSQKGIQSALYGNRPATSRVIYKEQK